MLTNEEKRVKVYHQDSHPTRPETVNQGTLLASINLNWRERDLPERERTKHVHRLHPYLGKFIPQLVEVFLRKYFSPGQRVLDPFCGSGTTLVQANELGIHSIGFDISAFNVLLCRAKTAKYDLVRMRHEVLDVLEKTHQAIENNAKQLSFVLERRVALYEHSLASANYLQQWYAPQALNELVAYRHFIETGHYEYQDLLKIILARSARSTRLTTHFDLDFPKAPQTAPYWCYKHGRICEPTIEAFKFLKRYSLDTIQRVQQYAIVRTDAEVEVCHGDSRKACFPPINGIITSPPYVGLIDYHEQHAYAYHLLGLEDWRDSEIGAAANGSSERAKTQYKQGIVEVFSQALKSISRGGYLIVIANDKHGLYDEIGQSLGIETEDILQRHVNRRTGRRSSEYYESIFVWRKP